MQKRGFTLVEAVMVIAISSILALGIGNFIITSLQAWLLISQRDAALNGARAAMNRMVSEIRLANKPQNISLAAGSELRFSDLQNQSIDYRQSGTDLLRNQDVLASGLATSEGLVFTYLNSSGGSAESRVAVASVRIRIRITTPAQSFMLESSSRIRNLY